MLSDELWVALELEPDAVARRGQFFSAYRAARRQYPAPVRPGEAGANRSRGNTGLSAHGEPPGLEDGDGRVAERSEPGGGEEPGWVSEAEEGDTLREAALSMLMVDAEQGRARLEEAAKHYERLSVPYALFLRALGGSEAEEELALIAARVLSATTRGKPDSGETGVPVALAQLVHLMVVFGSSAAASREFGSLPEALEEHPAARSGLGFGRTGAVIADWWRLGLNLLALESEWDRREELRQSFARLALRHGEQLARAQMDSFHWRALQSPVELVDLDLAGALCLANKRLVELGEPFEIDDFADLPPLARVSLAVGRDMGMGMNAGSSVREPEPEPA